MFDVEAYLKWLHFKKHPKLLRKENFEVLKWCVENIYQKKLVLFCLDVEAWERDINCVTEIGISIYDPLGQEEAIVPSFSTFHLRIAENSNLRNGRYVADNTTRFSGLESHILTLENAIQFIEYLLEKYFRNHLLPCCLVGHDLRGDIQWLKKMGIDFPENCARLDTQKLIGFSSEGQLGLTSALHMMGIPHANLHNAGNDAYYTLVLALKLSDPYARNLYELDSVYLREKITRPGKKKNLCPQIEVSDVSDLVALVERGYWN